MLLVALWRSLDPAVRGDGFGCCTIENFRALKIIAGRTGRNFLIKR